MGRWTQAEMKLVAEEERADLHLGPRAPLDPYQLAEKHGIRVFALTHLGDDCPEALARFGGGGLRVWSAALVPVGSRRIIIENDTHGEVRRRSSIGHELGHFLLEHQFQTAILADGNCRHFDAKIEKEARFISGHLLIPEAAARRAAFDQLTDEQIATRFNVSTQFVQMRMHGLRIMATRALQKQARVRR